MPQRNPVARRSDLRVSRLEVDDEAYVVFCWTPGRGPQRGRRLPASLSPAERAVLSLLLENLGDAAIASLRGTTRSTVTKQIDAIFRKLGVRSRRELIALHSSQRA